MGFFDIFKTKKGKTTTLEPMLTDQQKAAQDALLKFMQNGSIGNYQAGADYGGALGDFNMTDAEKVGQSKLMDLINGALPDAFTKGQSELSSVLEPNSMYDPTNPNGVYKAFKAETQANYKDAQDALNRQLSLTGDTYSTNKARSTAQLNTNTTNALNSKLAELYQNYTGQRLNAATGLMNSGVTQEGLNQGRINLANTAGSLPRLLADAQAKAKYSDWLRQQTEKAGTINAANTLFNKNVDYGLKSITGPSQPSTFMSMLGEVFPLIGSYNTAQYGYTTNQTSLADAIKNFTGGGTTASGGTGNTTGSSGNGGGNLMSILKMILSGGLG